LLRPDEKLVELASLASRFQGESSHTEKKTSPVLVPADEHTIHGDLTEVPGAKGIVVFAHGSGSSRHSARNKYVAGVLNECKLATLLVDLLTVDEEAVDNLTREYRFAIDLLSERLVCATDWVMQQPGLSGLYLGYFGASTGAAAAIAAAAERPGAVRAIVSRGGRPDLAADALEKVLAPTLLIVGELDQTVLELNRLASKALIAPAHIEIVPGATHLFEEPGALQRVALLARDWFEEQLIRKQAA
jgi:putative phosphoribosyl transferase